MYKWPFTCKHVSTMKALGDILVQGDLIKVCVDSSKSVVGLAFERSGHTYTCTDGQSITKRDTDLKKCRVLTLMVHYTFMKHPLPAYIEKTL